SETWTFSIPRRLSSAASAREYSSAGLPERSLTTQTLCQFTGKWIPVPRAFEKASFAAKRLARYAARRRRRRKTSNSEATSILWAKRSPNRSSAFSMREISHRSVPIPRITRDPAGCVQILAHGLAEAEFQRVRDQGVPDGDLEHVRNRVEERGQVAE